MITIYKWKMDDSGQVCFLSLTLIYIFHNDPVSVIQAYINISHSLCDNFAQQPWRMDPPALPGEVWHASNELLFKSKPWGSSIRTSTVKSDSANRATQSYCLLINWRPAGSCNSETILFVHFIATHSFSPSVRESVVCLTCDQRP